MNLRVPETAPELAKDLAAESLATLVEIMRGTVKGPDAANRRNAAKDLREEICGAVKQKVEHSLETLTDEQLEARFRALVAKEIPQEAGPTESAVAKEGADLGLEGEIKPGLRWGTPGVDGP